MIQCYHSCSNSPMNWYLSHLCLAVLFLVVCGLFWLCVFLFVCLLVLFVFGSCCCFCFFDNVVTDWTMYRSFTRSLLKPLNLQAAMYASISQFTLVCNMQLNVLDDLAEAMKALDGKKCCFLGRAVWQAVGCLRFGPLFSWFPPLPSPLGCLLVLSGPVSPAGPSLRISGCFATVRLSYLWYGVSWLIGSCLPSASWQQRLRPCVGLCPLHHVVGVVHVPPRCGTEVFALG